MSGRLDQSLDSIIDSTKKAKRDTRRRKAKPVPASVGGVKKTVKPIKSAVKPPAGPAVKGPRNSKIIISGLPHDATEVQIKEYFTGTTGPIKRVALHYNQNGTSRGIAEVTFHKPESATKAAKEQNGILIDKKPIKASIRLPEVEVVVDASSVPEPPAARSLAERVAYANSPKKQQAPLTKNSANPKAKPKSAAAVKPNTKDAKKGGKPGKTNKPKNARPKPKTAEELDAEMTDYWGGNNGTATASADANNAATNGAAATTTTTAEDAMEEISVSQFDIII